MSVLFWFIISVLVAAGLFLLLNGRQKELQAATGLRQEFIGRNGSMERYKLSWVPSISDFANEQVVKAIVNGAAVQELQRGPMSLFEKLIDVDTNATVEWWITTIDDTGTKTADSDHMIFTAANLGQLEPATGLGQTWMQHLP